MASKSSRTNPPSARKPARKIVQAKAPEPPLIAKRVPKGGASRRRRIAIACQGGGSQTAFTAGALRGLFEAGVHEEFDIVSLSGTSGGAICATLAWYALVKGDTVPWQRLYEFWQDNMAATPAERVFNRYVVETMRMTGHGWLPTFNTSPSAPWMKMTMSILARGVRPLYIDFRGLLEKHIAFDELAGWGPREQRPILMLGAVDVLSGRLAKFSSRLEPIRVEHILASCAVPSIFEAVQFEGGAYWDGLFSDNPPINEMVQARYVGAEHIAQEIWAIKINPTRSPVVPASADEIGDRRNELIGNVSLFHQVESLAIMNELYLQGAFAPEYKRRFDLDGPVLIPKCFSDDEDRPYHIPFIEMSEEIAASLDYESKLDRSKEHIEALLADGERQALVFLEQRKASGAASKVRMQR